MGKTRKDRQDKDYDYRENSGKRRSKDFRRRKQDDDVPFDWRNIRNVPADEILDGVVEDD